MSWSQESLAELANQNPNWTVDSEGEVLSISNDEGLDAFVYVGTGQILVNLALFPVAKVSDVAALNNLIMRSHHLLPLSAICVETIGTEDYYVAFGALSTDSQPSVIIEEIEVLFANVPEFFDLYAEYIS
ncbi:DUF2170 family protein [Alginatibacterium sediminis]|uniref:DUF2170 family protein n=1 Tax=Alginatibacterium sediminis TaxID=2164068 RepID=A0A420E9L5_9ALTE|nr:DUF2170 family protein [Alginatibacterium sediminis]RKF15842.1 DUF2170 family protein [Alginatibacterium sediminis]